MKTIRVQFEVSQDRLPLILQLLAGEVSNIATRDMADVVAARQARDARITGKVPPTEIPPAEIRGAQPPRHRRTMVCILKGLRDKGFAIGSTVAYTVVEDILESHGFARTSCSPCTTAMVRDGIAVRLDRHSFRLLSWGGQ